MSTPHPGWGTPPWAADVPVPPAALPDRVEVAVVGAGFTGLAVAWDLARRGLRVAVLEASRVGAGASGRTGGVVLEETAAGALAGTADCIGGVERLLAETGIACDLELRGCLELAHRAPGSGLQREPALAWRDGEEMLVEEARVPGGVLDPGALLRGLARAALAAGATLHEQTPVRRLEPGAAAPVVLADRALGCEHVVLGLNAFTGELLAQPAELVAALTLALCTAPLGDAALAALGLAERLPFYTADLPYLWGRPLADGRLVLGSGMAFAPRGRLRALRVDRGEAARALGALEARVRALHPALGGVRVECRWGGPVAFRAGAVPLLGRAAEDSRVIVTGAYAGHGVALGLRAGALAAAAVADGLPLPAWGAPRG